VYGNLPDRVNPSPAAWIDAEMVIEKPLGGDFVVGVAALDSSFKLPGSG
jgi:hypothetical protein